ncbi:unnamed protein product [Mycena citricolor]|uniref:Uncharacterized protein n=1 Tax=Mycena citricolor TaxID=2018698 RepID=A0AAD2K672_9AGAR|nr:unnamed protein product [Mycena citricolor]
MSVTAFRQGGAVIVVTRGPGNLNLLSYSSNAKIQNHVGATNTNNSGVTRFLISHSYTFEQFAFHWDGQGEAAWSIGNGLVRQPVGKGWNAAVNIQWNGPTSGSLDVSGQVSSAVNRDGAVTCFIIPEST